MDTLKRFLTANGKSCFECKHFIEGKLDCSNPKFVRQVTNKFDFDTHTYYPCASGIRTSGGVCKPDAIGFEAKP